MSASTAPDHLIENQLLAALPGEEYERILPHLEPVSLTLGEVIYWAGAPVEHIYFPTSVVFSLLSALEDGTTVEVGVIGGEGMLGIPVILGVNTSPHEIIVRIRGGALRMKAAVLRDEFDRGGLLHDLLLRYTHALMIQGSQMAVCNRLHAVEERLCGWLLAISDRVKADEFLLSQEFISRTLGARRSGQTGAAGVLEEAGLIRYTHGHITLLNRQGLEVAACECYRFIKEEFGRFLSPDGGGVEARWSARTPRSKPSPAGIRWVIE